MSRWHSLTRKHTSLTRDDGSAIIFCGPEKFRFWKKDYKIFLMRGRGYLWEEVTPPKNDEDVAAWWEGLNIS